MERAAGFEPQKTGRQAEVLPSAIGPARRFRVLGGIPFWFGCKAPLGIRGAPAHASLRGCGVTFVGREVERRAVRKALEAGQGVVLRGRFGIGRTALVRQVAVDLGPGWRFVFVDSRETPASVCVQLADALLFPPRRRPPAPGTYRANRSRLSKGRRVAGKPVVVLDDIGPSPTRGRTSSGTVSPFVAASDSGASPTGPSDRGAIERDLAILEALAAKEEETRPR